MGIIETIKGKYKDEKISFKQKQAANRIIKKKSETAFLKAREQAAIEAAKSRAKYVENRKLQRFKERDKSGGFLGAIGQLSQPSSPVQQRRTSTKRNTSTKRSKSRSKKRKTMRYSSQSKPREDINSRLNKLL